jgi:hypothetical protein
MWGSGWANSTVAHARLSLDTIFLLRTSKASYGTANEHRTLLSKATLYCHFPVLSLMMNVGVCKTDRYWYSTKVVKAIHGGVVCNWKPLKCLFPQ